MILEGRKVKMEIIKKIRSKIKFIFSVALVAAFALQLLLPVLNTKAGEPLTPKFNFMANDPKTLRGVNRTENQTAWQDSVSGKAGDEYRGLIYVHNGMLPSVARNTKVKVTLPEWSADKKFTVKAEISADNAATVTDTLMVSLDQDAQIQFIPDTVAWFPSVNDSSQDQKPLPNGQNGNEIVTNGINIGDETNFVNRNNSSYPNVTVDPNNTDVHGCWEYISYISFGFKTVKEKAEVKLSIDKTVRNVTLGESNFVEYNQARAKDDLEYHVLFRNTGNSTISRVVLTDIIPGNSTYISGSTRISLNGGTENQGSDKILTEGLAFANLKPGEFVAVKFRVKIASGVAENEILVNSACIWFDKADICDIAKTTIKALPIPPGPGPVLPVSGAMTYVVTLMLMVGSVLGINYFKRRKMLRLAENVITTELLSR